MYNVIQVQAMYNSEYFNVSNTKALTAVHYQVAQTAILLDLLWHTFRVRIAAYYDKIQYVRNRCIAPKFMCHPRIYICTTWYCTALNAPNY